MTKFYISDDLRMYRSDERNITLEKRNISIDPKTKEEKSTWRAIGYFWTYQSALKFVIDKDLLVDETQIKSVQNYLDEIVRVKAKIKELVRSVRE